MNPYTPNKLAAALVALLAPVILAFSVFIANEAQIIFDMHLEGPALAAYISAFLVVLVAGLIRLIEGVVQKVIRELVELFNPPDRPAPPGEGS